MPSGLEGKQGKKGSLAETPGHRMMKKYGKIKELQNILLAWNAGQRGEARDAARSFLDSSCAIKSLT